MKWFQKTTKKSAKKSVVNRFTKVVFLGLMLWLFVRVFILQIYKVPSNSMNNTLQAGDYVVVSKISFGARIPITPLSFPIGKKYVEWIQIPYTRIWGFNDIQRNDILVFNFPNELDLPVDHRQEYVKRCVGLPGDKLSIRKGKVFVNGKKLKEEGKINYRRDKENRVVFSDSTKYSTAYFPHSSKFKWNGDYFGKIEIPKKGKKIKLNSDNFVLYSWIIEKFEEKNIKQVNDAIYIDGIKRKNYTFALDYYFVLGDNRGLSNDSRFWGFLPEDHIIGKVWFKF